MRCPAKLKRREHVRMIEEISEKSRAKNVLIRVKSSTVGEH